MCRTVRKIGIMNQNPDTTFHFASTVTHKKTYAKSLPRVWPRLRRPIPRRWSGRLRTNWAPLVATQRGQGRWRFRRISRPLFPDSGEDSAALPSARPDVLRRMSAADPCCKKWGKIMLRKSGFYRWQNQSIKELACRCTARYAPCHSSPSLYHAPSGTLY